jgi:hypothetical protein
VWDQLEHELVNELAFEHNDSIQALIVVPEKREVNFIYHNSLYCEREERVYNLMSLYKIGSSKLLLIGAVQKYREKIFRLYGLAL